MQNAKCPEWSTGHGKCRPLGLLHSWLVPQLAWPSMAWMGTFHAAQGSITNKLIHWTRLRMCWCISNSLWSDCARGASGSNMKQLASEKTQRSLLEPLHLNCRLRRLTLPIVRLFRCSHLWSVPKQFLWLAETQSDFWEDFVSGHAPNQLVWVWGRWTSPACQTTASICWNLLHVWCTQCTQPSAPCFESRSRRSASFRGWRPEIWLANFLDITDLYCVYLEENGELRLTDPQWPRNDTSSRINLTHFFWKQLDHLNQLKWSVCNLCIFFLFCLNDAFCIVQNDLAFTFWRCTGCFGLTEPDHGLVLVCMC